MVRVFLPTYLRLPVPKQGLRAGGSLGAGRDALGAWAIRWKSFPSLQTERVHQTGALFLFDPSGVIPSLFPLVSSHPSPCSDGPTWVRTRDLPVMSRWLFQLSYGPSFYYIPSSEGVNPCRVQSLEVFHRQCLRIPNSIVQISKKLFNFLARLGCRSFLRAFASIWRILSRVTSKSWPTSSKV